MALGNLTIDLAGVVKEFNLNPKTAANMADSAVKAVTGEVYRQWDRQASKTLKSTRVQYRSAIIVVDKGPAQGEVVLTGVLPNMLENGWSAFDMKPGLLGSPKAKQGKHGKYITVAFRHAQAGAVGESSAFTGVLSKEVTAIIKKQSKTGGKGLKLNQLPAALQAVQTRPAFSDPKTKQTFAAYTHKAPLLQGAKKTDGGVVTFRRVSERSDPNSWINRGRPPLNLAEKSLAATPIQRIVNNVVTQFLNEIL